MQHLFPPEAEAEEEDDGDIKTNKQKKRSRNKAHQHRIKLREEKRQQRLKNKQLKNNDAEKMQQSVQQVVDKEQCKDTTISNETNNNEHDLPPNILIHTSNETNININNDTPRSTATCTTSQDCSTVGTLSSQRKRPPEEQLKYPPVVQLKCPPEDLLSIYSPNTLIKHIQGRVASLTTPQKHILLGQSNESTSSTVPTELFPSTDRKASTDMFTRQLESADTPERNEMYASVQHSMWKKQRMSSSSTTLSDQSASSTVPIDPHAFRYHPTNYRSGAHRGPRNNDPNQNYNLHNSETKARQRAVHKTKDAILSAGNDDQIALGLQRVLEHPSIRPYYQRVVGVGGIEAIRVGKQAIEGMRSLVDRVADHSGSGGRSRQCRSLVQSIVMCLMSNKDDAVSNEAIRRHVLSGLSVGTANRLMAKAGEKRKRFEENTLSEFRIVEEEETRCKYTDSEKEALRKWMCNNLYTRQSPNRKDTINKRDINNDLIDTGLRDEAGKIIYETARKVLITVCARELHCLMVKPANEGGFEGAYEADGITVRFSKNTLRHYWPNWLKVMSDNDKVICGCSTCCDTDDVNDAYNGKRKKIVAKAEVKLEEMSDSTEAEKADKAKYEAALNQYKSEIFTTDNKHVHERGWSAAEQYGCGKRISVCSKHYPNECPPGCIERKDFPHFRCQKGDCKECIVQGYTAPDFEMNDVDEDEIITYTLFTPHTRCTLHGGHYISEYEEAPKYRCSICHDELTPQQRKEKKAKVIRKKFRTKHTEKLRVFAWKDGTYAKHLRKMVSHKNRVILLGRDHKKNHRRNHAKMRKFVVKLERDFAERYSVAADKEQQFQYFAKDSSLGIEGITAYLKPHGKDTYETHFYSILSTEKEQDGRIVYANTKIILEHLKNELDGGADICHLELSEGTLEILDDSDGCAEQYRCGTALYMLHKLAEEEDIIYDRGIDAEGHGKKDSDGISGGHKHVLAKEFTRNVEYQPEQMVEHKRAYLMCDMSEGNKLDFADLAKDVLTDPSIGKTVAPNKPRSQKPVSDTSISKKVFEVRKEGVALWSGLKMSATGFDTIGKGNGITSMYNFRFQKALGDKFAYCRYPCSCKGCYDRLQLDDVNERYGGSRDTCYLWPIMQMKDKHGNPIEKGYNDWSFGMFQARSDCKMDEYHASKADTLHNIGKMYSDQIAEGELGAYCVADHPEYPYYLVEWLGVPWQALRTETISIDAEEFFVKKGDWLCEGVWMEKIRGARNWHTMTEQQCVVKLETVLHANINLRARGVNNPLPRGILRSAIRIADDRGAWRMSDRDHAFLMEESRTREMNNEFDQDMALAAREEHERQQMWKQAPVDNDDDVDEDEDDT